MSITDDLRTGGIYRFPSNRRVFTEEELTAIADRIDAEHERLMAERRRSCVFYDAERNYCMVHDEVDIADFGWIRLPKDANGEYVHIGDVMENIVCPPVHREVTGVGAECFYGWDEGNGRYSQFDANCYRHYHAPTVEDVLRDVVTLCHNTWKEESPFHFYDVDDMMKSGNIAEFAAKLRLAGDAE